jgi:hypothetical protein
MPSCHHSIFRVFSRQSSGGGSRCGSSNGCVCVLKIHLPHVQSTHHRKDLPLLAQSAVPNCPNGHDFLAITRLPQYPAILFNISSSRFAGAQSHKLPAVCAFAAAERRNFVAMSATPFEFLGLPLVSSHDSEDKIPCFVLKAHISAERLDDLAFTLALR